MRRASRLEENLHCDRKDLREKRRTGSVGEADCDRRLLRFVILEKIAIRVDDGCEPAEKGRREFWEELA